MLDGGFAAKDPKALRMSLVGTLDRGSKEGGWFKKTDPATYQIREGRNSNNGVETSG
jgi:hypothetical protein